MSRPAILGERDHFMLRGMMKLKAAGAIGTFLLAVD
jgi:hypothetical protein